MKDTFENAMRLNTDRFQIKDFFTEAASLSIAVKKSLMLHLLKIPPAFENGFLCRIFTENTLNLITVCSICL